MDITKATNDQLRDELKRREKIRKDSEVGLRSINGWMASPRGLWRVVTEGDCEGKSVRDLGVHEGHIADIAHGLGGYAMYSLTFSPAKQKEIPAKPAESVAVTLDIESKTWDLSTENRAEVVSIWLRNEESECPFTVEPGGGYAAVTLNFK